jgi:hypothetical protein
MLKINSPEFSYEDHMLFDGPNGELLRQVTYSNGAQHVYRVDEATGRQTPIAHSVVQAQQEAVQAKELVDAHTHYAMGGPSQGEYGRMDWGSAINEIFDMHAVHKTSETAQWHEASVRSTSDENEKEQSVVDAAPPLPEIDTGVSDTQITTSYLTIMKPSSDPASIDHEVVEANSREPAIVISGISQQMQSQAITHEPKEPAEQPEHLNPSGVVDPSAVTLLGMAVVARGGRERFESLRHKFVRRKDQSVEFFSTEDDKKNKRRRIGAVVVAVVATGLIFLGFASCEDDDGNNSKPVPTASASPSPSPSPSPEVEKTDTKNDKDDDKKEKETPAPEKETPKPTPEPNSISLTPGGTVWGTAHDLLEERGFNHENPNTDAIKDAMLEWMKISEAQAHYLAVNTEIPLFDDDEIEDILDNFSNTIPNKIK